MKIVEKIKNLYNKTFNDEIIAIKPPYECFVSYRDLGRRLEGYKIPVKYKYKGWKECFSSIDCDHFILRSQKKALKNALEFYDKTLMKINERQKEV